MGCVRLEALILAGGKGTRLRPLTYDIPKPMVPVSGRPFLDFLLTYLADQGVDHCVFSLGFLGHHIRDYVGTSYRSMSIDHVFEESAMGTGGAILHCLPWLNHDNFLILNGDSFLELDLHDFMQSHLERKAQLTVALKHVSHGDRYGVVAIDTDDRILGFRPGASVTDGEINAGIYALHKSVFDDLALEGPFSFESDVLHDRAAQLRAFGYRSDGYFIDIGVPEDLDRARNELPSRFESLVSRAGKA